MLVARGKVEYCCLAKRLLREHPRHPTPTLNTHPHCLVFSRCVLHFPPEGGVSQYHPRGTECNICLRRTLHGMARRGDVGWRKWRYRHNETGIPLYPFASPMEDCCTDAQMYVTVCSLLAWNNLDAYREAGGGVSGWWVSWVLMSGMGKQG